MISLFLSKPPKWYFKLFSIFGLIVIFSCSSEYFDEEVDHVITSTGTDKNDKYIVILSDIPSKGNPQKERIMNDIMEEIATLPEAKITRKYERILSGFAAELSEEQIKSLQNDKRVKAIYNDIYIYPTDLNVQNYVVWGLDRLDSREVLMDRAYAYTSTGQGVTAYVVDSGINYSHEEFSNRASLGYDFVLEEDPENTNSEQVPGDDCTGHGTHVAGTIGGVNYGVAKEVGLVSVRVFGCNGGAPLSRLLAATEWITENASYPAVVNMSLGGSASEATEPLKIAIKNSIGTGINYIVAAGNNSDDACLISPANVNEAITVGATDIFNHRAGFSNYGECVDIFAPGHTILSASHLDNHSGIEKNGTSMAAPHVTGIAALYLEINSLATPLEVHNAIVENSTPNYVEDLPVGTGNFAHSLWTYFEFTPPSPPNLDLQVFSYKEKKSIEVALTWKPTSDRYVKIYKNGEFISQAENDGIYYSSYFIKGNETFNFQVCEINYENCSDILMPTEVENRNEMPNIPPEALFDFQQNERTFIFKDDSRDRDGIINNWTWDFGDGNFSSSSNPTHTYDEIGFYKVSLTVTDDNGASDNILKWVNAIEPEPVDLFLEAAGKRVKGVEHTELIWSPAGTSDKIDIYLNGRLRKIVPNTGSFSDRINLNGNTSLVYKICISKSLDICSEEITVQF